MSQPSLAVSEVVEPADIEHPLERLRAGDVFVHLRHDSVRSRATALEALLGRIADPETKLVWIGNPLRSPLTLERFFLQAVGAEADLRSERTPSELAALLQDAAAPRGLLIVQQPETLDPEARDTLARIAPLLSGATPAVQFLFCGTTTFRPIAAEPHPPPTVSRTLPALALLPSERQSGEAIPESHASEKLPLLLILLIAGLGALIPTSAIEPPGSPAGPPLQTSAAPAPEAEPARPEAAAQTVSPAIDTAELRREFDAFLAQQPPSRPRLTQQQRDVLFDEFLARQQARKKL